MTKTKTDTDSLARKNQKITLIGLTGGIGCGQSTVAGFLEKMGVKIINADQVARDVVDQDANVREEIKQIFGNDVFFRNGELNRKQLGSVVFVDDGKVQQLNRIVHPRMVERIIDEIEETADRGKYRYVAIDAALIYEIQLEHMFDVIIVVAARTRSRIERVQNRDGLPENEIMNRIKKQIPIKDKIQWADFVIHNNSTLEQLEIKTRKVFEQIDRSNAPAKPRYSRSRYSKKRR